MTSAELAADTHARLDADVAACTKCPELRRYCAAVAAAPRRAYRGETYHGAPVAAFGDPEATLLIVGLAPGAHGSNRTGRPFTGDASGVWLYRALHRAGFANQAEATGREDGLRLHGAYITAAVRCAPPANKPTTLQRDRCAQYLEREFALLRNVRAIVTLGRFADDVVHALLRRNATYVTSRPPFSHGAEAKVLIGDGRMLEIIASYHPSRQNTNTRKLTEPMLDAIFSKARVITGV